MFRISRMKRLFFSVLTAFVLMAVPMLATNGDSYIQLTRISLADGNVGYQRVPDEEWAAVSINMPLEPGDRIYTGRGGRAEIEFEEGSVLRLAENTDIEFIALDEDYVQIRMMLGTASITVERGVVFEIATPAAAFTAERNGIYRFEVAQDGRSDAIVRRGTLDAVGHNFMREIRAGDRIRAYPDIDGPVVMAASRRDTWDEWTDRRDADRRPSSTARRHIPDNVSIGVAELDRHGRWVYVTNHGWGWIPHSVASSWSPYSVGRWVYRAHFGWTWVSYETWGWLPYHYGRWYRDARFGWAWFPGDGINFRFWSPGLVAFYRGPGWVSWAPLGPGDYYSVAFYHYRRVHATDLARVRLLAVRQPGNYININVRGAFQTVNLDHFRGVNSSGQNARNDINQPWRQGNLVRGGLDVSPARESFRPAPDRRGERPQAEAGRPVVVRRTPSQASGNDGRFVQVNNPRPASDRQTAERGDTGNTAMGNPSGNRNQQTAPAPSTRPAPDASPARQNNPGASSRDTSATSRPSASQENRQTERSGGSSASASTSTRGGSAPVAGNPSGSRNPQAAPAPSTRPAPDASPARQNNQGSSAGQRPSASPQNTARPTGSGGSGASRPGNRR